MANRRQVRVNSGRLNVGMSEVGLQLVQRHTRSRQMCRKTVPQDMAGHLFGHADLLRSLAQVCAQTVAIHSFRGGRHMHSRPS